MNKDNFLKILSQSLFIGLLISGLSFFIKNSDSFYGWPFKYFIRDSGGCSEFGICETPLTNFFPERFIYNLIFWGIIIFVLIVIKNKKEK